jgi:enoyl-CoA hydratase/carnithine racemase
VEVSQKEAGMGTAGVHGTGLIAVRVEAGIGTVEIRRPEKKNALSSAMGLDLLAAVRGLEADPGCKVIVLSGQGGDLSSGADLSEQHDPGAPRPSWAGAPHARLLAAIAAARIPVVAVIEGWALGIGLGLVGAAAYAVAGEGARFALPEVKSGYLPFGVIPHLTYRTRADIILRWSVTGSVVSAAEALDTGLVTHVAVPGAAADAAAELAAELASAPRELVEQGMRFLRLSRLSHGAATVAGWCDQQMDSVPA